MQELFTIPEQSFACDKMKHYSRLFLLVFVLASVCFKGYAQKRGQALIDSLQTELASDKFKNREDSVKVKLLERLSFMLYAINPDDGIKYGVEGLALATKIGWKRGIATMYNSIAVNYQYKSAYDTAQEYFDKSLKVSEEIGYKKGIATCLGNKGYCYTLSGDLTKALEYDLKALKIWEEISDKPGLASNLGNIGSLYLNKGDYANALDYSFKALKINEELGSKNGIATNYGSIGSIYTLQKDYAKALEYYYKALAINKELGKKNAVAGNYANIGSVYSYKEENVKALEYFFQALKLYEEIGAKTNISIMLGNIGEIYQQEHNYTQSIAFLSKALKIARETGNKNAEAEELGTIGECYMRMVTDTGKSDGVIVSTDIYSAPYIPDTLIPKGRSAILCKSKEYITAAIKLENEVGNLEVKSQLFHRLSLSDSLLGDYKGALDAYQKYTILRDSIFNGETRIKITNLETKRELELKDKQIQINKLAVEKKRNERVLFIAGIVLLLLVIVFILRNYQAQRESNILLSKEKKRSEDLLLNILPAEVADELKEKGTAAARYFDDVTVLFTDFVNFTEAGERMNPQQLIDELDTCFKAFDEIINSYNVEKIKTIGDAYLAVGGLPTADPKHAENIVRTAIQIQRFMAERREKLGDKTFEVRIGIHSGSVVAGIVGVKKFQYDIWGDTVNTAARLQQNSEPGKINISETTYELIKDKFPCLYRGEIDAKNKGVMKMYFVS